MIDSTLSSAYNMPHKLESDLSLSIVQKILGILHKYNKVDVSEILYETKDLSKSDNTVAYTADTHEIGCMCVGVNTTFVKSKSIHGVI